MLLVVRISHNEEYVLLRYDCIMKKMNYLTFYQLQIILLLFFSVFLRIFRSSLLCAYFLLFEYLICFIYIGFPFYLSSTDFYDFIRILCTNRLYQFYFLQLLHSVIHLFNQFLRVSRYSQEYINIWQGGGGATVIFPVTNQMCTFSQTQNFKN